MVFYSYKDLRIKPFISHSTLLSVESGFKCLYIICDAIFLEGPLITRQPVEYSWMLGNPTPLMKIGQSLFYTGSSTQGTKETLPDFREWCRVTRHS